MPDIPATEPIQIPPKPSQTFGLWRISRLKSDWPTPTSPLVFEAFFRRTSRPVVNDPLVDMPLADATESNQAEVNLHIPDLWELAAARAAAGNPKIAQAINLLAEALVEEGILRGIL